jgi:hypothetical protein
MRYLAILFLLLTACKQAQNKLEEKEKTLDLTYIDWACACPNWALQADVAKYEDADSLSAHCVYIEPADSSVRLPDSLGHTGDIIRFKGRFYKEKSVPAQFADNAQKAEKAKILRYTSYEIVWRDSYVRPKRDTLVITRSAAVYYGPDSTTIANRMSEENFRIAMDDAAGGMQEATEYMEQFGINQVSTEDEHFIKFIHADKSFTVIRIDSLKSLFGIFLFDPYKTPKDIDYFNIEKEYQDYFKK